MCSDIIATGCNDKCVRVYYLATSIDKELKKFTGKISSLNRSHHSRVVHVSCVIHSVIFYKVKSSCRFLTVEYFSRNSV